MSNSIIERLDTPSGRFYKTPDGTFPSVTSILSAIPNPELEAWKQSIGKEEAERVSRKAATRGTHFHSYCEAYLKEQPFKLDVFDKQAYLGIEQYLDKIDQIAIEKPMWSKKLRAAGTADCIGKYNNTLSLIDFKTTSQLKFNGQFDTYWMQTAAYAMMAYERYSIKIDQLVIIMQNLTGETIVYKEKTRDWCSKFIEARDAFEYQQTLLP